MLIGMRSMKLSSQSARAGLTARVMAVSIGPLYQTFFAETHASKLDRLCAVRMERAHERIEKNLRIVNRDMAVSHHGGNAAFRRRRRPAGSKTSGRYLCRFNQARLAGLRTRCRAQCKNNLRKGLRPREH